jgi:hypothetical protein
LCKLREVASCDGDDMSLNRKHDSIFRAVESRKQERKKKRFRNLESVSILETHHASPIVAKQPGEMPSTEASIF